MIRISRMASLLIVLTILPFLTLWQGADAQRMDRNMVQAVIINNFNTRRAQLDSEISQAAAVGSLSPQQEWSLRTRLNQLANMQAAYMADGFVNNFESQAMLNGFADITVNLNSAIAAAPITPYGVRNRYLRDRFGGTWRERRQLSARDYFWR